MSAMPTLVRLAWPPLMPRFRGLPMRTSLRRPQGGGKGL